MTRNKRSMAPRVHVHAYERLRRLCAEIQRGRCPTREQLARLVERHSRTVQRDLTALRDQFSAPLVFDRERKGFRFSDPEWRVPEIRLTEGELIGFFAAERLLRRLGASAETSIARAALRKLAALLPDEVVIDLSALEQAISFAPEPVLDASPEVLRHLAAAATARRTVRIRYFSQHRNAETLRDLDVYLLHNHLGEWYAVGHDHLSGEVRDFHAGRILDLRETDQRFERSSEWKADEYFNRGFGMFRGGKKTRVEAEFDAGAARYVRERKFHPTELRRELRGGRLRLSFDTTEAALGQVMRWLMQYGRHVRVIKPEELRRMIREEVGAMDEVYGRK